MILPVHDVRRHHDMRSFGDQEAIEHKPLPASRHTQCSDNVVNHVFLQACTCCAATLKQGWLSTRIMLLSMAGCMHV